MHQLNKGYSSFSTSVISKNHLTPAFCWRFSALVGDSIGPEQMRDLCDVNLF